MIRCENIESSIKIDVIFDAYLKGIVDKKIVYVWNDDYGNKSINKKIIV